MRKKILIVDDDSTTRKYLQMVLQPEGFEIIAARDGIEALEKLAGKMPDLVITDLDMPRMDGAELVRNIRKESEASVLPVILLTTEVDEETRVLSVEVGASEYLVKPVSQEVLKAKVRAWIETRKATPLESGG